MFDGELLMQYKYFSISHKEIEKEEKLALAIDTTNNDMTRGVCILTEPAENVSEPSGK